MNKSIRLQLAENRNQSGVTLLLAILVLSAVVAISLSLSTVLFVELRNSGDLTRTEPALYAANAVTEEALFNVKRNTGVATYSGTLGNVGLVSTAKQYNDAIQQDRVLITSNTFAGTQNLYALYNPADPYAAGGYGRVKVTLLDNNSSGTLHVYLCQFDPKDSSADCNNQSSSSMVYKDVTPLSLSGTRIFDTNTAGVLMNPSLQQELILYQEPGGVTDMYVQIETFDGAGSPKGIPFFGQTAVDIAAGHAGVTRRVRVIIPSPSVVATTPVTYVQSSLRRANSPNSVGFSSNTTAGNLIVVAVSADSGMVSVASVTDNRGNSYTRAVIGQSIFTRGEIWYARNISGGNTTVTVTMASANTPYVGIAEYTGANSVSPLDQTSVNNSPTAPTYDSGSVTTATSNELIFGFVIAGQFASVTAGAGFTMRQSAVWNQFYAIEDKLGSTQGSYSASFEGFTINNFGTVMLATFRP